MTALLIGKGSVVKKWVSGVNSPTSRQHRQPIINGWREVSPVWVNKPIDETKGENGTTLSGTVIKVIRPEIIKLRR